MFVSLNSLHGKQSVYKNLEKVNICKEVPFRDDDDDNGEVYLSLLKHFILSLASRRSP
jgi:hypothetical protein